MDLLKNPFHILGATTRDDKFKITDLAEGCRLLSDADECTDAESTLKRPQNRISAEIGWLPGVNPEHIDSLLKQLESPHQNLLNIVDFSPLARANVLTAGLSRLSNIASTNLLEWILAISHAYERIEPEEVRGTLNEERNLSGFPQITDLSVISTEIQNQRRYYSQTLSSVINNLSVTKRARILTLTLETVIGSNNNRCPILIDDLIQSYEQVVVDDLKKKQNIIEAQIEKIRAMVNAENPATTLQQDVDSLLHTVKEWDTIAQPIQLSKRSRGERHPASVEITRQVRNLAIDLLNKYCKPDLELHAVDNSLQIVDISLKIVNTLKDRFTEVPELVERLTQDLNELKMQKTFLLGLKNFKDIITQVEKLKEAADAYKPDYTLTSMVNQLLETVNTWTPYEQPIETNNTVALTVRGIALYLLNKHQKLDFAKLDFAIQIITAIIAKFRNVNGMDEVNDRLNQDLVTLMSIKQAQQRKGTGCLLQIAIFGILALIGALLQGC